MTSINDARQTALIDHGRAHFLAHLWKIEMNEGTILYITDHDRDINDGTNVYSASSGIQRSAREASGQLSRESNMSMKGAFDSAFVTAADVGAGFFDGAKVTERVVDWRYPRGIMVGDIRSDTWWISRIKAAGDGFTFELEGVKRNMRRKFGGVIGRLCRHQLGGDICDNGVNIESATYKHSGTVSAIVTQPRIFEATLAGANNFYNNGKLVWTSGANVGVRAQVKLWATATNRVYLEVPLPFDIVVGDAFNIYAGCNKTLSECETKFSNLVNFGGEPFVPLTETALPIRV